MTNYILYSNGVLEGDGFNIPIDENNPDYLAYLDWVALGNTPVSMDGSVYLQKLTDDKANWQQIKAGYQTALNTLDGIINQPLPLVVNLTVIQTMVTAIQNEAKIQKQLLKFIARRLT